LPVTHLRPAIFALLHSAPSNGRDCGARINQRILNLPCAFDKRKETTLALLSEFVVSFYL
jgi:hypothetical protein